MSSSLSAKENHFETAKIHMADKSLLESKPQKGKENASRQSSLSGKKHTPTKTWAVRVYQKFFHVKEYKTSRDFFIRLQSNVILQIPERKITVTKHY